MLWPRPSVWDGGRSLGTSMWRKVRQVVSLRGTKEGTSLLTEGPCCEDGTSRLESP